MKWERLFVPYAIAYKLKQLDFKESCLCAYRNSDGEESLMGYTKY